MALGWRSSPTVLPRLKQFFSLPSLCRLPDASDDIFALLFTVHYVDIRLIENGELLLIKYLVVLKNCGFGSSANWIEGRERMMGIVVGR